ncbi:MAG: hypothetical protein JETT_3177 [Candidatus Jettenia ecosi]|uniref:Uncharacterized protein n=1 Tax=Candidatus Jettenia ecosi TaxID=2494326 RepID=A0A533QJ03_9BACT|nr:MAG: hypothetical protein JETT_3177 [Candidatus Jettenia ecosi]
MRELLEKYKAIIAKYEIITWDSEPSSYRLKANLYFINDPQLIIKDYLFPTGRKYSFHWQDEKGNLIIRWDNATHWKGVNTFPLHKHEKNGISDSKEIILEDIIEHIYTVLRDK